MRKIEKGSPPPVVAVLRRTPGATWASVHGDQKAEMRLVLGEEQRGLCAYCMARLPPGNRTTVEHWKPRSEADTDPFAWPDLLAVCEGGGGGAANPTCDRRRGDEPLNLHPARASPQVESLVRFKLDGRFRVTNTSYDQEVVDVLGLDAPLLVAARKEAIDAVVSRIQHARTGSRKSRVQQLRRMLELYESPSGKLPPFPTAVVSLLRRALAKASERSRRLASRAER